jgi:outer membrane protein assembly factor BamC
MKLTRIAVSMLAAFQLTGCSLFGVENKQVDYRAESGSARPLEVPPGLTAPAQEGRYAVSTNSDSEAVASYSDYSQDADGRVVAGTPGVLPQYKQARLEHDNGERWLVVEAQPGQVWDVVKGFWMDKGFTIASENPQAGLMETEWAENRDRIPEGGLRGLLGKAFDGLYSSPEQDKYLTRLERSKDGQSTEIYITQFAKEEVQNADGTSTSWRNMPRNPAVEASMLQMLRVKLGGGDAAEPSVAAGGAAAATAAPAAGGQVSLQEAANGEKVIVIADEFDKSWRRVGLALERAGLTIEDKNRADGVYFIITGQKPEGERSWLDALKFWKSDEPEHYRVTVRDAGNATRVTLTKIEGGNDDTTGKLLESLYNKLK